MGLPWHRLLPNLRQPFRSRLRVAANSTRREYLHAVLRFRASHAHQEQARLNLWVQCSGNLPACEHTRCQTVHTCCLSRRYPERVAQQTVPSNRSGNAAWPVMGTITILYRRLEDPEIPGERRR